jgi:hypothetical protein
MDRIGGKKIVYNLDECQSSLRELSENFREYSLKKRKFIDKEHREMEQVTKDGGKVMVAAPKTGMNWFNAGLMGKA